jgi:hypothetical protein
MDSIMPRPFSTSFSHAIDKPKQRTARVHTGLSDPIKQAGFGRGDHFRAFTAAEKIEGNQRTFSLYSNHYNPATDTATMRPGSMDAFACPSRIGDVLYYRSGEVELDPIPANPKPAYALY